MYRIILKKSAVKELDGLEDYIFKKIDQAILSLMNNPHPFPASKKLEGDNRFRLRAGDYRIIYTVDEKERIITVYKVRHRKDVYR